MLVCWRDTNKRQEIAQPFFTVFLRYRYSNPVGCSLGDQLSRTSSATGWKVSAGLQPAGRGDGKELFYLKDNILMAIPVDSTGKGVSVGLPTPFKVKPGDDMRRNRYLVTKD